MKHSFVLLSFVTALTACQTVVTPASSATFVPEDRVYTRVSYNSQNPAKIVVVRDSGILGSGVDKRFYVNDDLIAQLAPGEKIELKLDAGDYIFSTHPGPSSTILANEPVYLDQHIESGKFYYYRLYWPGQIGRVTAKLLGIE